MTNLENLTRRGFLALSLAGALSLACRGKKRGLPVDLDNPSTPDTPPEPQPQQDFHHYSGTIRDTDSNLIPNVNVKLRVRNDVRAYESASDSNGNYRIQNLPNGDYVLTLENIPGFFGYQDPVKIISAQGGISRDFFLIRSSPLISIDYRNLLDMLKDVTENRDGRAGTPADSVQKVRRFDLATKVKVFLDRSSLPGSSGYAASVQAALNEWQAETGLPLFEETILAGDSNIRFLYANLGEIARTEILKQETKNGVGIIKKARILIDTNLSLSDVRKATLREVGTVLLGAKRGSKDDIHAIFKNPNNPNLILSTGITDDESKVVKTYYGLPIGEDLNPYRI